MHSKLPRVVPFHATTLAARLYHLPACLPPAAYRRMGLNRGTHEGKAGIWYREWAPGAKVSGAARRGEQRQLAAAHLGVAGRPAGQCCGRVYDWPRPCCSFPPPAAPVCHPCLQTAQRLAPRHPSHAHPLLHPAPLPGCTPPPLGPRAPCSLPPPPPPPQGSVPHRRVQQLEARRRALGLQEPVRRVGAVPAGQARRHARHQAQVRHLRPCPAFGTRPPPLHRHLHLPPRAQGAWRAHGVLSPLPLPTPGPRLFPLMPLPPSPPSSPPNHTKLLLLQLLSRWCPAGARSSAGSSAPTASGWSASPRGRAGRCRRGTRCSSTGRTGSRQRWARRGRCTPTRSTPSSTRGRQGD